MSKTQDEELVSALDQPIRFDPKPVLEEIDTFYNDAKASGDVMVILDRAKLYITNFRMSGLALAKLLYMLKRDWHEYDVSDTYEDVLYDILGISKLTINRYVGVWGMFAENLTPAQLSNKLQNKPMKSLIPMAKTLEQGFEVEDEEWQELADAPDDATIRGILRDIKGQAPRKGGITIKLKRNGDLIAYNDGTQYSIGFLENSEPQPDVVKKAVERICSSAGISRE